MAPPPNPDNSFDYSGYPRQRPDGTPPGSPGERTIEWPAGPNPSEVHRPDLAMHGGDPTVAAMDRSILQSIGNPPVYWLVLAAICVAAGIAVAVHTGRSQCALAAWALDGPIALSALAFFTRADLKQRSRTLYNPRVYAMPLYGLILAGAAVGVVWSAWLFANWLARR